MTGRVAVVGLGRMGSAMAARLAQCGWTVTGYDQDPSRMSDQPDSVRGAATLAAALANSNLVVSSLPDPSAVRSAWLDEQGLSVLEGGSVLIETSTVDPATVLELAAHTPAGVSLVDSPVSGGPLEARAGRLTMFVGGDDAAVRRARPVLDELGGRLHRTGAVGSAKVVKIVNNIMSMTNIAVAAEAFAIGTSYGLEPEVLYSALAQSGGTSAQFVKRFPRALAGDLAPGFALDLAAKDLALGVGLAETVGIDCSLTRTALAQHHAAQDQGLGALDHVAIRLLHRGPGVTHPEGR